MRKGFLGNLVGYRGRLRLLALSALAAFAADQGTKLIAAALHPHAYAQHEFAPYTWWLLIFDVAVAVVVPSRFLAIAAGLIAGGVAGNMLDHHAWPGGTPSFIDLGPDFGNWNLAGFSIIVGLLAALILIIDQLRGVAGRRRIASGATLPLRDNQGQVIVIFALWATALLGLGGLVVDLGNYSASRKAQATADAAALAGARYLPNAPGTPTDTCKTVPTSARSTAQCSVASNLSGATADTHVYCDPKDTNCGQNGASPKDIRVTVHTAAKPFLLRIFGFGDANVTKSAIATRAEQLKRVGLFAYRLDCTADAIQISGDITVTGAIISNGGLHVSGSAVADGINYHQGCPIILGGGATVSPTPVADPVFEPWPFIIPQRIPPCTKTDPKKWAFTTSNPPQSGNVYCAPDITFGNGVHADDVTFVANDGISVGNDVFLNQNHDPYWHGVLFVAYGTGSGAVKASGNGGYWRGIVYTPHGQSQIPGHANIVGFVEAHDIHISGDDNFTSTGPFVRIGLVVLIG